MKEFKSFYKEVKGNEGSKCQYNKRLDTYGCGCQHDCSYCYAKSLLNFRNLWDEAEPSVAEIAKIERKIAKLEPETIVRLGGMTDCFQPLEKQMQVTKETIKLLNKYGIGYLIVTKSDLVCDYLNILDKRLAHIQISTTWIPAEKAVSTERRIKAIVRSDIDYVSTWEVIEKKLIDLLGGYIIVRHEDGINYLDYLAEINLLAPQTIQFGKNLLDLKRIRKGEDIATVVIPLGAKLKDEAGQDTETRLTINAVNGGVDFVQDSDAIAQFGTIVKSVIFEDVTDAENLKAKGSAYLADSVKAWETIELTAADLATVDKDITSFRLGTQVRAESKPHGLEQLFLVSKLSINLLDPAAARMTLGKAIPAFSEAVKGISDSQGVILQAVEKNAQAASEAVYNVEQNLQASIQVSEDNIKATVAENYYLKDDTDALVASVSTEIEQTKNSVEIQFNQFSADMEAVAAGADAEFEEIRKYIRFVDGQILLGEVGNELELQISNDRISFLQDGAEVAYFSNRKLYVTDTQILHSLQLGNFAFMPRENGNLSFKRTT